HDDQRRRRVLDHGALGERYASPAKHEDHLVQRAVHVRTDLPVMARTAEPDRLDVQRWLVVLPRRFPVKKEARYLAQGCCGGHVPYPFRRRPSWYARVKKVQVSGRFLHVPPPGRAAECFTILGP